MKKFSGILFIFLFICFTTMQLKASEITVYHNESMPWCGTVNGKESGITVDLLKEITKHGGPKFKFVSLPWKRAHLYVKNNSGTGIIPLTRTPQREKDYTWIIKLVSNKFRLTMAKNPTREVELPDPLTIANSKSLRVGIILGSAMIPIMKELGFTKLINVSNAEENAKRLSLGSIDVLAESSWVDTYLWRKIGRKNNELIIGPVIDTKYIYFGAGLNFPQEVAGAIRRVFKKMKRNGFYAKTMEKLNRY